MMRCFLPCFRTSKRPKQLRSPNASPITHVAEGAIESAFPLTPQEKSVVKEPIDCIAESNIEASREEEAPQISEKKNDYEESSESLFSLNIGSRIQVSAAETAEIEVNSPMQFVCRREESEAFGSSASQNQNQNLSQEAKEENTVLLEEKPSCIAIEKEKSSAKELIENQKEEGKGRSWNDPVPEYRYRDCSDEVYGDLILDGSDLDATSEGVNRKWGIQEESSESLFSLSTDSRKQISSAEAAENEVNSLIRITQEETQRKSSGFSSVLNPIENLTQERVVKAPVLQPQSNDKENINLAVKDIDIPISPEPSLKLSNRRARQNFNDKEQQIGVDTSLSSWLVESETTPISIKSNNSAGEQTPKGGRGSPWSHEDRPILGALTVEEIKMYSISTSSRKSRSRSPDETPIIGTVGSYWSHTGQNIDSEFSKSGKDARVKWSSTKVKTRLERAFEASVAEV